MANLRTLDLLLDRLQGGDESWRAPRPALPIARVVPVERAARDGESTRLPLPGEGAASATAEGSERRIIDTKADVHTSIAGAVARTADISTEPRAALASSPSASLELSATAQWLQRSLLPAGGRESGASIRAAQPLLSAPPADPHDLARALQTSIAESGLFYESHLADWVVQRYPESLLRREPQAHWNDAAPAQDAPQAGGLDSAASAAPMPVSADVHPSADLMRAQLQALESRQLAWQGELWPGQEASITITDDGTSTTEEVASQWRTRLTLTLPELGRVEVELRLVGASIGFDIAAGSLRSVELMREAGADLVASLQATAQSVTALAVRQA